MSSNRKQAVVWGAGGGVGVGMLRGRGFLGSLVSWFLVFLVSGILGFFVSWFQSFLVSWFHSFKVSMIPHYQKFISCFMEDTDTISKTFKILSDGSSIFFGAHLFQHFENFELPSFSVSPKLFC